MKNINWIIAIAFTLSFSACKDDNNCSAGAGGNVTIVAFVQHHGCTIVNHVGWPDTVFVKYNAKEFPGTNPTSYDTAYIGEVGEDHVHLEGLQCGDYFLYAVGFDSTCHGPVRVAGGIPFSTTVSSGEVETNIPATE